MDVLLPSFALRSEPHERLPAQDPEEQRREEVNDWFDLFAGPLKNTALESMVSTRGFLWDEICNKFFLSMLFTCYFV